MHTCTYMVLTLNLSTCCLQRQDNSKKLFFIVILSLGVFHLTGKTGFASIATLPIMESTSPAGDFGNVKKRCKVCR